jgi:putative heme iron utilization protein
MAMAQRRSSRGDAARALLRAQPAGVLCTASARHEGAPFGSLVTYALDAGGAPLFLLSDLSEHTRNLAAEPRASLFVADRPAPSEDPQTGARVCLVGRVDPVPEADVADARARFLARSPGAERLLGLDFRLYRLAVAEAHWVGGFAQAGWLAAEEILGE